MSFEASNLASENAALRQQVIDLRVELEREIKCHDSTKRDLDSTRALLETIEVVPGHIEPKDVALASVLSLTDETLKWTGHALHGARGKLIKLSTRLGNQYKDAKLLRASLQFKAVQMEKMKAELARLKREKFGSTSERIVDQLQLGLEDLEEAIGFDLAVLAGRDETHEDEGADQGGDCQEKRKPKRKPLPPHLPRKAVTHPAPDAEGCSQCGGDMGPLGEDVVEVLDYIPARFEVVQHVRPKLACKKCDHISQAPSVALPVPKGRMTPQLLAHVVVSKYCDHLPLYRQSEIYARSGVELNRSTLADSVGQVAWLLRPLAELIGGYVLKSPKVHTDDTTIKVLDPGRGKNKTGRFWTYVKHNKNWDVHDPPAAFYHYTPDRKGGHPQTVLKDYAGYLQADGYAGYGHLYTRDSLEIGRSSPDILEVACWAHSRRKFHDLWLAHRDEGARVMLAIISNIYKVERSIKEMSPEQRLTGREQSKPFVDQFFATAKELTSRVSAKSELAKACHYALVREDALRRFLSDGRLEVDNNFAENALRGIAVGRKNYLFAGSDEGGERAAILYTLIETAKLNGIDPEAWLADCLQRVADGHPISRLDALLPWKQGVGQQISSSSEPVTNGH
jgi:transposase